VSYREATRRAVPWGVVLLGTGLAAAIFAEQLHLRLVSDLPAHVRIAAVSIRTGEFPGDALYYLALGAATGLSTSRETLEVAAVALLALCVGAKLAISLRIALAELSPELAVAAPRVRALAPAGLAVLVLLVGFAFSIPTDRIYLGQFPPNVWHNSTTVFLMPFALALFWCSLQFLRTAATRWLWLTAAALVANVLAKPSLVLAFVPVFPIAAWARLRHDPVALRRALLLVAGAVALLGAQYAYVYAADPVSEHLYAADAPSHVRVAPFDVWGALSSNVPLSIAASLAFPLAALAAYGRSLARSDMVRYAGGLTIAAVALFALLEEAGPRKLHGNFAWQADVANYLLFLAVAVQVVRLWPVTRRPRPRDWLVALALLAHVAAGAWFLYRWWRTGTY
jgi:hypothetical protein